MNAIIYARYSSDKQTEDSIDAQIRACRDYAAANGHTIAGAYTDEAVSGKGSKTASRVQYQKMMRDCDKGLFSVILIHKYDRVARNLGEHVTLEKKLHDKGIDLIAVAQNFGTTNEAKIMRTLTWAMSEYYLDNLSDEVKKGHKETALRGMHNGGVPPFGYDVVDQAYVINEFEAEYVRRIFSAAANRKGYTAILKEMDERGIIGKRGKSIRYTQVYEMLRNIKYTGTYVYSQQQEKNRVDRRNKPNAIRIENAFPAIIDKTEFEEVQRIMDERKQTGRKAGYLCSGLVYCQCGAKMHGHRSQRKGHEYHYFICSKQCGAEAVRMEEVDSAATRYLHDLLSLDNQQAIAFALRQYHSGEKNRVEDFNKLVNKKIADKQKEYDALMGNLRAGALPPKVVESIGLQLQELQNEIEALRETPPPHDFTTDQITAWLDALKATSDEKAIHLLIERIDIKTKTDFNIKSTLESVLGKNGCGGQI